MPNQVQRALTIDILRTRKLLAPTVWFSPGSRAPAADDTLKDTGKLETNISDWEVEADERNLGVRLTDGLIELAIDAPDDAWAKCFFKACEWLKIDTRFAFGLQDKQITWILFSVGDPDTIDRWTELWPKGFQNPHDQWTSTKFVSSSLPTPKSKPIWRHSSPLPGSHFAHADVVWRPNGKPAATMIDLGLEDLESHRSIGSTTMPHIVEAIAYATLLFWILEYLGGLPDWDESLVRTIGGWLARVWREGAAINAPGKSLVGLCWSPIETMSDAGDVCAFLHKFGHAPKDLDVALAHADSALQLNPVAPIPGWQALGGVLSFNARKGIRCAFRAGMEIDAIERFSLCYVYDRSSHLYHDRDAIRAGEAFSQSIDALEHRHCNEPIFIGKKPLNPFKLYQTSQLRLDVSRIDFFPGHEPAGILRFSPSHNKIVNGEIVSDERKVLNSYGGIFLKPIGTIDLTTMNVAVSHLDRLLGLLTRDNGGQVLWIKKFLGWTIQHPDQKQQSCLVLIGGQGIGKSLFGGYLMGKLFGYLAGTADAASLRDDRFFLEQFISKLIVFIDEARLESSGAINQIKKIIRSEIMTGQRKYEHSRDHRVLARTIIAANQADIGLSSTEASDRTFFYVLGWDAESKRMMENEFLEWAVGLKSFCASFVRVFDDYHVCQHLMRYLMDLECTREELEDLALSSRHEETVIRSTMSKTRDVARAIVADARIHEGLDLTAWFSTTHVRSAILRVDGKKSKVEAKAVLEELKRSGVIETVRGDLHKMKFGYGKTLKIMGEAHSLEIIPYWDFQPGDFDDNPVMSPVNPPEWRGKKKAKGSQRRRDPAYPDDDSEPFDP